MADLVITDKSNLVSIADAIREKVGSTDAINFPDGFLEAIGELGTNSFITMSGTIIPVEDQTETVIDTGLIVKNNMTSYVEENSLFLLWQNEKTRVSGSYVVLFKQDALTGYCYSYGVRPSGSVYNTNSTSTMGANIDWKTEESIKITVTGNTSANYTYGLVAGVEYGWAFIFKGEFGV